LQIKSTPIIANESPHVDKQLVPVPSSFSQQICTMKRIGYIWKKKS